MLTANDALKLSSRKSDIYLKKALDLIEISAKEGKTNLTLQFFNKNQTAIPDVYKKNLMSALTELGYLICWEGDYSPKYAPSYKKWRLQIKWGENINKLQEKISCEIIQNEE